MSGDGRIPAAPAAAWPLRTAIARGSGLFALWLVLMPSANPVDLAIGALAAVGATAASLRLLPPDAGRVRFVPLLALLPRFLWQSLVAGVDVARRAFAPRLPLATGFIEYRTGVPRGQARNLFATITSLLPGSLPSGDGPDSIEYHCLDTAQPVAEQLAAAERRLATALLSGRARG